MVAIDLVRALTAKGVEFATDGQRMRWRNSEGRMTPQTVAQIAASKSDVIDFLARRPHPAKNVADKQPDLETYLAFIRIDGHATNGAVSTSLGWGATRAWQAEARLRASGRVTLASRGRAEVRNGKDPK